MSARKPSASFAMRSLSLTRSRRWRPYGRLPDAGLHGGECREPGDFVDQAGHLVRCDLERARIAESHAQRSDRLAARSVPAFRGGVDPQHPHGGARPGPPSSKDSARRAPGRDRRPACRTRARARTRPTTRRRGRSRRAPAGSGPPRRRSAALRRSTRAPNARGAPRVRMIPGRGRLDHGRFAGGVELQSVTALLTLRAGGTRRVCNSVQIRTPDRQRRQVGGRVDRRAHARERLDDAPHRRAAESDASPAITVVNG